jgi:VanZ family protein
MRATGIGAGWAWAAAIVWLSLTPAPPGVDVQHADKVGHLAAYGALTFWFGLLYVERNARIGYAAAFIAMGIGLEFIQGALGYRSYEVLDMVANCLGVALGGGAAALVARSPRAF